MDQFIQALIAVAIAFWTPYNGGVNPCPDGVQYRVYTSQTWDPPPIEIQGKVVAWSYVEKGNCKINYSPIWIKLVKNPQTACMATIHELGHSAMGLEHEPTGVMSIRVDRVPPIGACYSIPRRVWPALYRHKRAPAVLG
jgi:hypothetical protein